MVGEGEGGVLASPDPKFRDPKIGHFMALFNFSLYCFNPLSMIFHYFS